MYGQNTYHTTNPQRYRIGPIISNGAFHYALETSPYARDPKYVQAVMRSYIEVKEARGRSKQEIAYKLEILERELPAYRDSWQLIREEKRLPISRVLGGRRNHIQSRPGQGESWQDHLILGRHNTHSGPARQASTASNATVRPSAGGQQARRSSWQTLPAAATSAPARNPEDTDEPPPPPYARQDPEPDATRSLQVRLAQEAEQEGFSNLPEAEARRRQEEEDENNEQQDGGNAGAGDDSHGSPNNNSATSPQPEGQASYSPPPGAPPGRSPETSLQREISRRSEHQPSTPPTDPEEARIWEESQLEEAKRLSRASERERLELEEAMRLSLAESEQTANANAGPSSASYGAFEGDDSSDTASRRVSSYNPSQELESGYHRSASDVHRQGRPSNVEGVTSGMDHLTIPDGWGMSGSKTGSSGGSQNNLMDDDNLYGDSSPGPSQPALAPQRTGAVMQSNNPFLSPGERDDNPSSASNAAQQYGFPQRQPSSNSLRESPGSSRTQYQSPTSPPRDKSLPSIPAATPDPSYLTSPTTYEAPTGPSSIPADRPPTTDGQSQPPPLPARTVTSPAQDTARRPLPIPQGQAPALPRRNVSGQVYTPSNPPTSSFPDHSPKPPQSPSPSFFPQQSAASNASAGLQPALSTHHNGEDPLETLRDFHTVFLVDDSTSMAGELWEAARQALMGVAEIAARYDEAGVDIYFLNSKRVGKELHAPADVEDLFAGLQPRGATPTGLRLEAILREYMTRLERSQITSPGLEPGQSPAADQVKPMNLIVVTDGVFALPVLARKRAIAVNPALNHNQLLGVAPVDDPESVLIAHARRLDKGEFPLSQVGVQFLQIGNDSEAREALQELDDNMASANNVRDMVDTVTHTGEDMSADLIVKTLLGGINRRLDRRS